MAAPRVGGFAAPDHRRARLAPGDGALTETLGASLASRFRGVAFCHVPADEPIRLDRLVSADGEDDRWNRPGEPTVYLATEIPIAIAEFARHLEVGPDAEPVRRRLVGLSLDVDGLLDLRRGEVRRALGAPADPAAFRELETARDVGARARHELAASGLLVPSMAFADDPARVNLVLFMECLGGDLAAIVRGQHEAGLVEVRPGATIASHHTGKESHDDRGPAAADGRRAAERRARR